MLRVQANADNELWNGDEEVSVYIGVSRYSRYLRYLGDVKEWKLW